MPSTCTSPYRAALGLSLHPNPPRSQPPGTAPARQAAAAGLRSGLVPEALRLLTWPHAARVSRSAHATQTPPLRFARGPISAGSTAAWAPEAGGASAAASPPHSQLQGRQARGAKLILQGPGCRRHARQVCSCAPRPEHAAGAARARLSSGWFEVRNADVAGAREWRNSAGASWGARAASCLPSPPPLQDAALATRKCPSGCRRPAPPQAAPPPAPPAAATAAAARGCGAPMPSPALGPARTRARGRLAAMCCPSRPLSSSSSRRCPCSSGWRSVARPMQRASWQP